MRLNACKHVGSDLAVTLQVLQQQLAPGVR